MQYQEQLTAARTASAAALQVEADAMRELLATNPDDTGLSLAIDELDAKIRGLRKPTQDFWAEFSRGQGTMLENTLKTAQSFGDIWQGMLVGTPESVRDQFAKQAGEAWTQMLQDGSVGGAQKVDFSEMLSGLRDGLGKVFSSIGPMVSKLFSGLRSARGGIASAVGSLCGFDSGGFTGAGGAGPGRHRPQRREFVFDQAR